MRASSGHRADIQGLRAVAVLLVALNHAGVGLLAGGFVGVDVFFVLSGFLITGLLLAEARANGSVSLVDFYVRRARRILPAAALTLLVTDVAAVFLLNFVRARDAVNDSLYAAGFAANVHFAARGTDYFARTDPPSPLLHYWSLAVEEQFYLVWPLLLSLVLFGVASVRRSRADGRRRNRLLLLVVGVLAAVSLAWSMHLTATLPQAAYFSPLTRAWELGLGAALAVGAPAFVRMPPLGSLAMGWAGLTAIASSALLYSGATPFPGSAALLPTVGAALVIAAGIGERRPRLAAGRLLALRPMRIVGDRSYALYLWHWPVLILAAGYVGHQLPLGINLGLLVGAFLLSCVSYALVENPVRHMTRSRAQAGLLAGVAIAAVLGTATISLGAINRESRRFGVPVASAALVARHSTIGSRGALPEVIAAVAAARDGRPLPAALTPPVWQLHNVPAPYKLAKNCVSHDASSGTTSTICRVGKERSRKPLVLFGDSHAMMWLPAVMEMAVRDGWAVVPLLRTGCTPSRWVTPGDGPESCRVWYRWALRQVERLHPSVTLVGGSIGERRTTTARAASDGIVATAGALRRSGHGGTVVVIGDPEGLDESPVDCLLAKHASMASCTTTWPADSLRSYDGVEARTRRLGIGFVATRGLVCFERRCPAVIGHTIAYWDNSHLTAVYAVQVSTAFRAAFLAAAAESTR